MNVSIDGLEAYLFHNYGAGDEQSLFMKLVEEIGEIAEILNMKSGRKPTEELNLQAELGNEIADAIHYLVAIAAVNSMNLNDIILNKDKKAATKYKQKINLETFLSEREAEAGDKGRQALLAEVKE